MVRDVSGETFFEVSGADLSPLTNESGSHRLQRIPPTERRGRVHTSTVMVAIIDGTEVKRITELNKSDLRIEWYSGTGCGGQNRNKVQSSCRLTHLPSGITKTAQTRSRENSYNEAYSALLSELESSEKMDIRQQNSIMRKKQLGNGSNSNIIRTYCFQHGFVKNSNGQKIAIDQFNKGLLHLLW